MTTNHKLLEENNHLRTKLLEAYKLIAALEKVEVDVRTLISMIDEELPRQDRQMAIHRVSFELIELDELREKLKKEKV